MTGKPLDLELIRVFCTIHETKLLNTAAERLGVSPSAVSQSLRKLEQTLNTELFMRDCRPMQLTAAGRKLLREGRPLLEAADALRDDFRSMNLSEVSLRLGLGEVVTATVSPWLVAAIEPKVAELSIRTSLNKPLVKLLREDELDVCIYSEGLLDEAGWRRVPVYDEDFLVVTSTQTGPVHSLQSLRELAAARPFICYTEESHDRELADAYLRSVGIEPRTRIQTNSSYCLVGLVDQAHGWSILPPTNLWTAGAFAGKTVQSKLPGGTPLTRRTWTMGSAAREKEVKWLADLTRRMFIEHTLPELGRISSVAAGAARILGGATSE